MNTSARHVRPAGPVSQALAEGRSVVLVVQRPAKPRPRPARRLIMSGLSVLRWAAWKGVRADG